MDEPEEVNVLYPNFHLSPIDLLTNIKSTALKTISEHIGISRVT